MYRFQQTDYSKKKVSKDNSNKGKNKRNDKGGRIICTNICGSNMFFFSRSLKSK